MSQDLFQRSVIVLTLILVTEAIAVPALGKAPYVVEWVRQFGTSENDYSTGVAIDSSGNAFITGATFGHLGGLNMGNRDAVVRKYDTNGTLDWTRQLGSSFDDGSFGVATNAWGDVLITGWTEGELGGASAGGDDAFVSKYSNDGILDWTQRVGSTLDDVSFGVATDASGNVFISGWSQRAVPGTIALTSDAFVSKFSREGALEWTQRLEPSSGSFGVATDAFGNVFIAGITVNALGGNNDAFVSKYTTDGMLDWTQQLGSATTDYSIDVATDALGNVLITGVTLGALDGANAGEFDAFVSKYDTGGSLAWTRQLGTSNQDVSNAVAVDSFGNVFITGITYGDLSGVNVGDGDAFVSKYAPSGDLDWTFQLGSSFTDNSFDVATDTLGNVFITGDTHGDLGGPNAGAIDVFVMKLTIPEPSTAALLALGFSLALSLRHARVCRLSRACCSKRSQHP